MFSIEDRQFGWEEIVIAARGWGEWQPFVETVRQSLSCLRLAAKTGEMPAAECLHRAATNFRYARNLISADEARGWLARAEMSVEDWMNYLRGQLLREKWAGRLDEIVAANPAGDEEVGEVIRGYAVCSGKLDEWAVELAGRAAVAAESGAFEIEASARDLVSRIECAFERQRRQVMTPRLIETTIARHRLDWIRFDCRYIWFPEERIAREAACCLAEDGLTLEEVAHDARSIVQQWNFYLDELDAEARPVFLTAREGDALGPVKLLQGFPLFSILGKRAPAADDAQIRTRAEQAITAGLMEQAISERVKWTITG